MLTTFLICLTIVTIVAFINRNRKPWYYPGYDDHESIYKEMVYWSTQELSKYAEIDITHSNLMTKKDLKRTDFEKWNSSSVGNIAFIALHHSDETVRTRAKELLEEWKEWAEEMFYGE